MHECERINRYIGGMKHDIAQEIQLRGVTDFQEILAMAEKLDFFRRPRPESYGSNSNWGHRSLGTNEGATIRAVTANAAAAPFKGRFFACNRPGHRKRLPSNPVTPFHEPTINQLRTTHVFSKIVLRGGYHQIRVNPPDSPKAAFRTHYGSFEYTVMPFGPTNALATFQMTMNEAFRPLLDKCVIMYLDDILIYSPDRAQHL
ncbi:unnamed protein product [Closterium sp. NIES-54]